MFSKSKRLSFNKSSHFKISELIELRSADPLEFDVLFKSGEDLVSHAVSGKLKRVVEIVNSDAGCRIHSYFVVKMFQGALINGHLMIAAFIIDQGYPLCCHFIPNAFMQSLEIVDDALAISICELLVLANGMDVNCQEPKSWRTPLHVAVKRGLIETIRFLVNNGADVNAIAEGDMMPLNLADEINLEDENRVDIIALLLGSGARRNWRRNIINDCNPYHSSASTQSSMISFKGGGESSSVSATLVTMVGGGYSTATVVSSSSDILSPYTPYLLDVTTALPSIASEPVGSPRSHCPCSLSYDGAFIFSCN